MGFPDLTSYYSDQADQPNNFVDGTAVGESAPFSVDIPYVNSAPLFPPQTVATQGQLNVVEPQGVLASWDFDQSKITASLQDVIGSAVQATGKAGVQYAAGQINAGANTKGSLQTWFQSFQATKTGAQINAASYASQAQNFLANPVLWLFLIGGAFLFLMSRRG